jgi:Mg/Co/Ni transporter MgtE
MSEAKSRRTRAARDLPDAPAALAARLSEERAEDIIDILNATRPKFAATILEALPEALVVEVLDQPQLAHGAAILSTLPPDRAGRLVDLLSADRATAIVREMRVSVRNDLLARVAPETKAALDRLLPYPEDCAGGIMTTEFVGVPADWTVGQVIDHVRAIEHTRETVYTILVVDPRTEISPSGNLTATADRCRSSGQRARDRSVPRSRDGRDGCAARRDGAIDLEIQSARYTRHRDRATRDRDCYGR